MGLRPPKLHKFCNLAIFCHVWATPSGDFDEILDLYVPIFYDHIHKLVTFCAQTTEL